MTADEFLAIPPDGKRYELIDGEFITHSTPYVRHQAVLGNVLLVKIYRRRGASFVRAAEISTESGGEITSPLLPGFALDVNLVFEA